MKLFNVIFAIFCTVAIVPPVSAQMEEYKKPEIVRDKGAADTDNCKPVRPENAVKNKKARTVKFAFLIGADGEAKQSKIVKSSGYTDLDQAALDAFYKCTFHPALAQGQAVISWVILSYKWEPVKQD